ncbi:MAG: hypothetical protein R3F07_03995 [Opitutaceae bacterium]
MSEFRIQDLSPRVSFSAREVLTGLIRLHLAEAFLKQKKRTKGTASFVAIRDQTLVIVIFATDHDGMFGASFSDPRFRAIAEHRSGSELNRIIAPYMKMIGFKPAKEIKTDQQRWSEYVKNRLGGRN